MRKFNKIIGYLVSLVTIAGFLWSIFTYYNPSEKDTKNTELPTKTNIIKDNNNTNVQPLQIEGGNNKVEITNGNKETTTIHADQVVMPDSRENRGQQTPDDFKVITRLELKLNEINKLREKIFQQEEIKINLPQNTCEEKNKVRRLANYITDLKSQLRGKEEDYNREALRFNLDPINETYPNFMSITYFPLPCE